MIDALGTEKPGTLVELSGMPYLLNEGLVLSEVKTEAEEAEENTPDSLRCRLGRHKYEVIARPEMLPPDVPESLLGHYVYLAGKSGNLLRCERCKKLGTSSP